MAEVQAQAQAQAQANVHQAPARSRALSFLQKRVPQLTDLEALDAEIGVYNATIEYATSQSIPCTWRNPRFLMIYDHKVKSIVANLDERSYVGNSRLLTRLKEGECAPHVIASMPPGQVFPEMWNDVIRAKVQREEYMMTARPAAMTDQFLCGRCKKRECTFTEMQMRSCDEPASLFIQCLTCGHKWRLG